jgi:hypothetical protein
LLQLQRKSHKRKKKEIAQQFPLFSHHLGLWLEASWWGSAAQTHLHTLTKKRIKQHGKDFLFLLFCFATETYQQAPTSLE